MRAPVSPEIGILLEKAADDNGFDRPHSCLNGWLEFSSTHSPLRIWLAALSDELFLAAFSQAHVVRALGEHGIPLTSPLPEGALAGRTVTSIPNLDRMLRRAFQLSRSLPNAPLEDFESRIRSMPRTTEAERLVVQRVGQVIFRSVLIDYWEGRCAVTGLAVPELLRASHIKPWADCESDAERLDVFNGLLLAPHLDAAFDRGFITFDDNGTIIISLQLSEEDREKLGIHQQLHIFGLTEGHKRYLPWHREKVFRSGKVND